MGLVFGLLGSWNRIILEGYVELMVVVMLVAAPSSNGHTLLAIRAPLQVVNQQLNG
jgi:hypothetical protein